MATEFERENVGGVFRHSRQMLEPKWQRKDQNMFALLGGLQDFHSAPKGAKRKFVVPPKKFACPQAKHFDTKLLKPARV
jgi:hypothetical protein